VLPLSPTQRRVFAELLTGKHPKCIAKSIGITHATLKLHITQVYVRLGVRGRHELMAKYMVPTPAASQIFHFGG